MTARPFRAGDRVRWRVPEDKSGVGAREWLRANRDPDKQCRWCHGTGAVLLVFSNVPCDCVRGGS